MQLAWGNTAHKLQGSTVKSGSQLVVHWHKNMPAGMAYVMLGRTELLSDMYIAGDFNVDQIKCDQSALAESNRLLELFDDAEKKHMNVIKGEDEG